jgi:hypothetical protein
MPPVRVCTNRSRENSNIHQHPYSDKAASYRLRQLVRFIYSLLYPYRTWHASLQGSGVRSRIDDFEILRPLGKGSFATVFLVRRKKDSKLYALKRIDISKMKKKEIHDCLSEIRFLASLRHPNVIAYYDSFLDEASVGMTINRGTWHI